MLKGICSQNSELLLEKPAPAPEPACRLLVTERHTELAWRTQELAQVLESGKLAAGKKHAGRDCGDDGGVHHAVQAMASVAAVTLDSPLDDDGSMSSGTQVESVDEAYIATHFVVCPIACYSFRGAQDWEQQSLQARLTDTFITARLQCTGLLSILQVKPAGVCSF